MSRTEMTDVQMQNLLDAITNALLVEQEEIEPIVRRYDTTEQAVAPYLQLISRLRLTLQPRQPSDQFLRSLKADLMSQRGYAVNRTRRFPMRAQLAAFAAAIAAGFLLFLRRRGETRSDKGLDLPALQG